MKILLLTPGSWIHSKRTLECLLSEGHEVILADGVNPYPHGHARFHFVHFPYRGERFLKPLLGGGLSKRIMAALGALQARILRSRFRPDIIHVCWLDHRANACARARLHPLVLSAWGSDINRQFMADTDPSWGRDVCSALTAADLTIVDAPGMSEKCNRLAGRELCTQMLHLGVDTNLFRPGLSGDELRREIGIPQGARVVTSMRALASHYNHHLILQAFASAAFRLGNRSVLLFKVYNSDADYERFLHSEVVRLGIADAVRWVTNLPFARLPELYAISDVIVNFPSLDSFPVTFMEAAACERPVVSCRLATYEGTFAQRHFTLVDPENVAALADAITEVVGRNNTASEIKQELATARRLVEREFSVARYAVGLTAAYRSVLGPAGANRRSDAG